MSRIQQVITHTAGDKRVDVCGRAGGEPGSCKRNYCQKQNGRDERQRIGGPDAEEQACHEARDQQRCRESDGGARVNYLCTSAADQLQGIGARNRRPPPEMEICAASVTANKKAGGTLRLLQGCTKFYFISLRRMLPNAPTKPVPSKSREDGSGTVWPVLPIMSKAPSVC